MFRQDRLIEEHLGNPLETSRIVGRHKTMLRIVSGHRSVGFWHGFQKALHVSSNGSCGIDDLVGKIEAAGKKKEGLERRDMEEKIQKVVESPSGVFRLFPRKK